MNGDSTSGEIRAHWAREHLTEAILDALREAGKDLDALTLDDLAPFDQFHTGGKRLTVRLAKLAGLEPGMQVLDVGGGVGGPARTLALEFGCHVTVVDLTESYINAGRALTSLMKLDDRVMFHVGDALDLAFLNGTFDAIWTQNAGMNIANKEALYAGFQRLVRPKGLFVIQEPMAGPTKPFVFPVMWSRDEATHFVRTPDLMRATIEAAGFDMIRWEDVTQERDAPGDTRPVQSIQQLVMGEALLQEITRATQRNVAEHRVVTVQGVFRRRD
jgi:SAM-dependent methyltransferase